MDGETGVVGIKGDDLPFDMHQTGLPDCSELDSIAILVFSTFISCFLQLKVFFDSQLAVLRRFAGVLHSREQCWPLVLRDVSRRNEAY